jgi:hypothetical protein
MIRYTVLAVRDEAIIETAAVLFHYNPPYSCPVEKPGFLFARN